MESIFKPGDTVECNNPQTNNVERGTVVKFTNHNYLHVNFGGNVYRIHPQSEKVVLVNV